MIEEDNTSRKRELGGEKRLNGTIGGIGVKGVLAIISRALITSLSLFRFHTGENIVKQITKGKREIPYRLRRCLDGRKG